MEDKVIIDLEKYNKQMEELKALRTIATELYMNDITTDYFREKYRNLNYKYHWVE